MGCAQSLPRVTEASTGHSKPAGGLAPPPFVDPKDILTQKALAAPVGSCDTPLTSWRPPHDFLELEQPLDEAERLKALRRTRMVEMPFDEEFDSICNLCMRIFKVSMASVAVLDEDALLFLSCAGLLASWKQLGRNSCVCGWVTVTWQPEILVVPDLVQDVRFWNYPIVTGWPHARFLAACPLVDSCTRMRMGSLVLMDQAPMEFSVEEALLLSQLTTVAMQEVERRGALAGGGERDAGGGGAASDAARSYSTSEGSGLSEGRCGTWGGGSSSAGGAGAAAKDRWRALMLCFITSGSWEVLLVNSAWQALTGISRAQAHGASLWDVFEAPTHAEMVACQLAVEQERAFEVQLLRRGGAKGPWFSGSDYSGGAKAGSAHGQVDMMSRVQLRFYTSSSGAAFQGAPSIKIASQLPSNPPTEGRYYWAVAIPPCASPATSSCCSQPMVKPVVWDSDDIAAPGGPTAFHLLPDDRRSRDNVKLGIMLGQGSFGRVHRGKYKGKLVAIKVVNGTSGRLPNLCTALEPLVHLSLQHPNIVQMQDVLLREPYSGSQLWDCSEPPLQELWMVQEYCDGGTLSDAVRRGRFCAEGPEGRRQRSKPDLPLALATMAEVASAMEYIHQKHILHGDLSGNNVLLKQSAGDPKGFVAKVADFGLSRVLPPGSDLTHSATHGTINYMAPEVVTGGSHSRAADVYSFGVLLWEVLSGEAPYKNLHYAQVLHAITSGDISHNIPDDIPADLSALLQACLSQCALHRPSFAEVHQRLVGLQETCTAAATA